MGVRDTCCLQCFPSFNGLVVFLLYPVNRGCHFFLLWVLEGQGTLNSPYIQLPGEFMSLLHIPSLNNCGFKHKPYEFQEGGNCLFISLSSHMSLVPGTHMMLSEFWICQWKAILPALKESLCCRRYKLNVHMPRQKTKRTLCRGFAKEKNKQKEKTDKRNQLFMCGNCHGKLKPTHSSLLNREQRPGAKDSRTDSARFCQRKLATFQRHPFCFYFKGKFWEVNFT